MVEKNIGAYIVPQFLGIDTYTANATSAATAIESSAFAKTGYESAQIAVPYSTVLTSGKSLTFKVEIADSPDDTNWNSYETLEDTTTVETGATATAFTGVNVINVDLTPYDAYVKVKLTTDLTATSADTAKVAIIAVLGGAVSLPVGPTI